MDFSVIVTGVLEENCYVVHNDSKKCVIIDPGDDGDTILDFISDNELCPLAILLTHGHFDHVGAVVAIKEKFNIPVYIHQKDEYMISDPEQKGIFDFGENDEFEADKYLEDEQIICFDDLCFKVLHTPGHSAGSCCFLIDDCLFSGDTLFEGSIGRCDLEGGSFAKIMKSINNKILILPDELRVMPGHGDFTDIGTEKASNPYLTGDYEKFN